jgi:hypothetical protein
MNKLHRAHNHKVKIVSAAITAARFEAETPTVPKELKEIRQSAKT